MAFSSLLRRASASVLPAARRTLGSPSAFRGGASTVLSAQKRRLAGEIIGRSFIPSSRFSTDLAHKPQDDRCLVQVLETEIEYAEKPVTINAPYEFPFEIEDMPGERIILLKRKFQDETIEVEVEAPNFDENDDTDGDEDGSERQEKYLHMVEKDDSNVEANLSLGVKIIKEKGDLLEFAVFLSPDEMAIENLSIKNPERSDELLAYDGPEFSDLEENLKEAFTKYLEVRGIKSSMATFLQEYMVNKDNKEYLQWLKNLKGFLEK